MYHVEEAVHQLNDKRS